MKLPAKLARIGRIDWRRSDAREAVVLFGAAILSYVVAHTYDLPPKLFQLGIDYADWELDDMIFVVFVMSIAMMIYAFRRYRDLSKEIKSRAGGSTSTVSRRSTTSTATQSEIKR
jgi:hypothetical protein